MEMKQLLILSFVSSLFNALKGTNFFLIFADERRLQNEGFLYTFIKNPFCFVKL